MTENMSRIEIISAKSLLEPGRKKIAGLQHSANAHRSKLQQMATTGANSFSPNRKWPHWSHLQQTAILRYCWRLTRIKAVLLKKTTAAPSISRTTTAIPPIGSKKR